MRLSLAIAILLLASAAPAAAQHPNWFPNGTPNRMPQRDVNLSCQNFQAIARGGDPRVMQSLSGTWENDWTMETLTGPSRVHESVQRWSSGELTYERSTCIASPIGGPPSCPRWGGHGYWTARMGQGGWIVFANWLQGSGPTGDPQPPNCASFTMRLLDENTVQLPDGSTVRRSRR